MRRSKARTKLLILDCCYSGIALDHLTRMGGISEETVQRRVQSVVAREKGVFALTSASRVSESLAPIGENHTAFTGQLIKTLDAGIESPNPTLTIAAISQDVADRLESLDYPRPRFGDLGYANAFHIAWNRSYMPDWNHEEIGLPDPTGTASLRFPQDLAQYGTRILSHLTLSRSLGIMGIGMPIVLALGLLVFSGTSPPHSMGGYFDTVMSGFMVAAFVTIGVLLLFYVGYGKEEGGEALRVSDNAVANLGAVLAFSVAFFPPTSDSSLVRYSAFVSLTSLFLIFAYFAFFRFTRGDGRPTRAKLTRNRIYRTCGITIIVALALISLYPTFLVDTPLAELQPVYWLESIAFWAFGLSWFVKGEGIRALNDQQ